MTQTEQFSSGSIPEVADNAVFSPDTAKKALRIIHNAEGGLLRATMEPFRNIFEWLMSKEGDTIGSANIITALGEYRSTIDSANDSIHGEPDKKSA